MDAGTMLKEARSGAGISQRELARRSGVLQPEISRIERGRVSPRAGTLDRLLHACDAETVVIARLGADVDRTLIAERLAMSPADRLSRTLQEWRRTAAFGRPVS